MTHVIPNENTATEKVLENNDLASVSDIVNLTSDS